MRDINASTHAQSVMGPECSNDHKRRGLCNNANEHPLALYKPEEFNGKQHTNLTRAAILVNKLDCKALLLPQITVYLNCTQRLDKQEYSVSERHIKS